MRRSLISQAVEEKDEPNITPMLDVVFILLIFFIVTANFIKEPGLEINRPDSETAEVTENAAILIACLLYTSPSPRDATLSRMPSSA